MLQVLEYADLIRQETAKSISKVNKSIYSQFMTSASIARFMASLFSNTKEKKIKLLDAGAGVGSLTCAFLDRCSEKIFEPQFIEVTAYETDLVLLEHLSSILNKYSSKLNIQNNILSDDFIGHAVKELQSGSQQKFTHAIINPPYKKINSNSNYRLLLRKVGIETVNLYSAFVALTLLLMEEGGQVVAIVPRSFCNGPYYKPFRKLILSEASIKHIHLFESRSKAFKDDKVLQENVILFLERRGKQKDVIISTSIDDSFDNFNSVVQPFNRIVLPNNHEQFIWIPTSLDYSILEQSDKLRYSLADIGVQVSTGPVVDFRIKEHIKFEPEEGCVPLLYPHHFSGLNINWPKKNFNKANALMHNANTKKMLYPNGFYTVVRRFSSKEEKRRIIASVVQPNVFKRFQGLGFENHLNIFHFNKQSLAEEMAFGLFVFLSSSIIDSYFRKFNGHTQVNATDLRSILYPSQEILIQLGCWVQKEQNITQDKIDAKIQTVL